MTTAELKLREPYTDIEAELATMETENEKAVFDYADPKGEKMARSHIYSMRRVKGDIEKKRKELKAESLAYGRMVDLVAKELTSRVVKMIEHHQAPLDEIVQKEADRKAAIQEAIDAIEAIASCPDDATSRDFSEARDAVESIEIDADTYQERMAEASRIKEQHLSSLNDAYEKALQQEAEQAELERLRAEEAARAQKEREDRIAAEAAEKAKRDAEVKAERERVEAERRAERERIEAERKAQAERDAAARREREAKERAERAEREAKEAEARAQADADRRVREAEEARERKAQAERDAQAKREADRAHVEKVKREAIIGVEDAIVISSDDANKLIDAIMAGLVPHVTITF